VRAIVNREFEQFVQATIRAGVSFALETTLRSTITFEQARLAGEHGFDIRMVFVAVASVDHHIERVKRRASGGEHAASEITLRQIYASSMRNLPTALDHRDELQHGS
jgi:predicted ABC-type ATPase